MRERLAPGEKVLLWVGSSKRSLLRFPPPVVDQIGTALSVAQFGGKHPSAKAWKGEGPGVFEIIEHDGRSAYRAVYTVRFANAIYVLHCFQKKSPDGIRTAKQDVDLIGRRLADARIDYEMRYGGHET